MNLLKKSTIPHIRLPRSLLLDPLYQSLSLKHQNVFLTIILLAIWEPQPFDDHGVNVDLNPGQICISEQDLADKCHRDVSKIDAHRAIKKLKLCGFLSKEVPHRKNLLTITHHDTYRLINHKIEKKSESGSESKSESGISETKVEKVSQEVSQKVSPKQRTKEVKERTTTPKPPKPKPVVEKSSLSFYSCLMRKEVDELTEEDKKQLMRFPEEDLQKSINKAILNKHKITESLFGYIKYFCVHPEHLNETPTQKLAHDYIKVLRSKGMSNRADQCVAALSKGYVLILESGGWTSVSTKDKDTLKKDIEDSIKEINNLVKICAENPPSAQLD